MNQAVRLGKKKQPKHLGRRGLETSLYLSTERPFWVRSTWDIRQINGKGGRRRGQATKRNKQKARAFTSQTGSPPTSICESVGSGSRKSKPTPVIHHGHAPAPRRVLALGGIGGASLIRQQKKKRLIDEVGVSPGGVRRDEFLVQGPMNLVDGERIRRTHAVPKARKRGKGRYGYVHYGYRCRKGEFRRFAGFQEDG